MHVVILSQYFYPELISTGQLLTELAEDLSAQGCEVTAIAGQPTYYDRSTVVPAEIAHRGIRILRTRNTQWDKNRVTGKIANAATFFLGALVKLFDVPRDAVVLVVTNPPFLPVAGWLLALVRRQRYVCLIHDVYPDIAVRLGYLRPGGILERLWDRLNAHVWNRASAIVVLGRDMEERLRGKLASAEWSRLRLIPNWADGEAIVPVSKADNPFLKEQGISPETFIVLYSGNMGLFHDMETIVLAAALLADLPVRFLFIGGGGKREKMERMSADLSLPNVTFLPYQPKENLRYSLSASDVSLVCLEKGVEGMAVPCKYYGILASGRPVIALMGENSEIGMSIREAGCGYVLPQEDPDGLAEKIRYLFHHRDAGAEMGARARLAFEGHYSRRAVSAMYRKLLEEVAE